MEFLAFDLIKSETLPDIWPNCFVLRNSGEGGGARFEFIGKSLAGPSPIEFENKAICELPIDTLLRKATNYADEVLTKRVPISRSGDFVNAEGKTCLYRSILLPLSGDQESIDYLLGAANYREIVHD